MDIVMRKIGEVTPYEKNPRVNDDAVDAVVASLAEYGWQQPIVVDADGVIIVGHTRLLAAMKLEMPEVPVHVADDLTPEQVRAYRIADNATGDLAKWDYEKLTVEIEELKSSDYEISVLGFDDAMLADILGTDDGQTDPDKVPEPQAEAVSKTGSLWLLGEHRLLCGDSTKMEDVGQLMGGEKAGLCFTSPPYGQQRDYTDASDCSDWDGLMQGVFACLPMADDGQVLVNLGLIHREGEWLPYWEEWIGWMREQGWRRFGWYVWDQGAGLPGDWNGRFGPSFEFVFHFNQINVRPAKWVETKEESQKKKSKTIGFNKKGGSKEVDSPHLVGQPTKVPDSVVRVPRNSVMGGQHPATFAVGLPEYIVRSWPGIVYEPFSGSGTTIIAAEQLRRRCYAVEIEPRYVDVAVHRWQDFTGKAATLDGDNRTFAEIEAAHE